MSEVGLSRLHPLRLCSLDVLRFHQEMSLKPLASGKRPPSKRDKMRVLPPLPNLARTFRTPARPAIGSVVSVLFEALPNTSAGRCKAFCVLARSCLEDARKLDQFSKGYNSVGEYILIAHALELSLKAFLAGHKLSEKALRKEPYGHNLDSLYNKAVELGLKLPMPHAKGIIAWVNEYHSGGDPIRYALRYAASTRTLPAAPAVFEIIDAILLAATA
jgi:hypothetical protein